MYGKSNIFWLAARRGSRKNGVIPVTSSPEARPPAVGKPGRYCARAAFLAGALIAGACAPSGAHKDAPWIPPIIRMTRVVFRDASPQVDPNSAAGLPRVLYRVGERYGRIEYPPNPEDGVHLVTIVAEPHIFTVNLSQKTGYYALDPGPSYVFRAPILPAEAIPANMLALEYGKEMDFLGAHEPTLSEIAGPNGPIDRFDLSVGDFQIVAYVDPETGTPRVLEIHSQEQLLHRVQYLAYERGLDPQPELFIVPPEFRILKPPPENEPADETE
jgi:hypothetical protein